LDAELAANKTTNSDQKNAMMMMIHQCATVVSLDVVSRVPKTTRFFWDETSSRFWTQRGPELVVDKSERRRRERFEERKRNPMPFIGKGASDVPLFTTGMNNGDIFKSAFSLHSKT